MWIASYVGSVPARARRDDPVARLERRCPGQAGIEARPQAGPWRVYTHARGWHIGNIATGSVKFIGPVRGRGKDFYDAAQAEASARNTKLMVEEKA
jgi:hypothetical protein